MWIFINNSIINNNNNNGHKTITIIIYLYVTKERWLGFLNVFGVYVHAEKWSWFFQQGWTRHVSTSVIVYGGLYDHYQWCHEPCLKLVDPAHYSTRDCFGDYYLFPHMTERISFLHITRSYCTLSKESVQTRIINSVNHLAIFHLMITEENRRTFALLFVRVGLLQWTCICNNDFWHEFLLIFKIMVSISI